MGEKSWTQMVNEVVVAGRPGDVQAAAQLWDVTLKQIDQVVQSLETNVKDLDPVWKGDAAKAFKEHVTRIRTQLAELATQARHGTGIVDSLNNAATKLGTAQADMPIPASAVGDVMAARNQALYLNFGFLEAKFEAGFFNFGPNKLIAGAMDKFNALLSDADEKAKAAYNQVSTDYNTIGEGTPGTAQAQPTVSNPVDPTQLTGGGPGGGLGGAPGMGSGGGIGTPPGLGSTGGVGDPPGLGSGAGVGDPPGLGSGADLGDPPGSGLAGAGGGLSGGPGLGSGLGAGGGLAPGLGGGGLGAGGGGGALGNIPGGGAIGRPIGPGIAGVGGAGAGGRGAGAAGRGAGAGGGGRLGRGGVGAAPGMAGIGGAGAGRGAGGGRGGVGGGTAGAGRGAFGGRGAGFMGGPGAGHGGDAEEHNSWLVEDDDVWGEQTDAPPPVLGSGD
jgi:uncharacterized protein YukE